MSKKKKKQSKINWKLIITLLLVLFLYLNREPAAETPDITPNETQNQIQQADPGKETESEPFYSDEETIPDYSGSPYVVIAGNIPGFEESELTTEPFELFDELDSLGRCGVTYANVCRELMPTEERGDISSVYPSGWDNNPYDFVDGRYVYNRCHLIGFQLTGENANKCNLITGTRYMNVQGMLPFENMVADHVKEEEHHVLYRVTPIFDGDNLVAAGVQMEALCVECHLTPDEDDNFFFNVYCYNVQPGVEIDYATGANWEAEKVYAGTEYTYVINTSSRKFHTQECENAVNMKEANRAEMTCTREEMIDKGFSPAGCCNP